MRTSILPRRFALSLVLAAVVSLGINASAPSAWANCGPNSGSGNCKGSGQTPSPWPVTLDGVRAVIAAVWIRLWP